MIEFNYLVEKKRMLHNLGRTSGMLCAETKCDVCPLSKDKSEGRTRIGRKYN